MRVKYDEVADAAYIYLSARVDRPESRHVDGDITLDIDDAGRLAGIEVLGASRRLDLGWLTLSDKADSLASLATGRPNGFDWNRLRLELLRRKAAHIPVETLDRHYKNWVEDVGDHYVVLRREKGKGKTVTVTRRRLEGSAARPYILRALRDLASAA